MSGEFRFETFVDAHSNIFNEYLSSVISYLFKENEEYKALQDKIESLCEQYPKVWECLMPNRRRSLAKKNVQL